MAIYRELGLVCRRDLIERAEIKTRDSVTERQRILRIEGKLITMISNRREYSLKGKETCSLHRLCRKKGINDEHVCRKKDIYECIGTRLGRKVWKER